MKAGRDLDALVAEKVLGCKVHRPNWYCTCLADPHIDENPNSPTFGQIFAYSTEIAAAWSVVEKLGPSAVWLQRLSRTGVTRDSTEPELVEWTKLHGGHPVWRVKFGLQGRWAFADTAPLAICLAALKAVGTV